MAENKQSQWKKKNDHLYRLLSIQINLVDNLDELLPKQIVKLDTNPMENDKINTRKEWKRENELYKKMHNNFLQELKLKIPQFDRMEIKQNKNKNNAVIKEYEQIIIDYSRWGVEIRDRNDNMWFIKHLDMKVYSVKAGGQ